MVTTMNPILIALHIAVDDMTKLSELTEQSLLVNLKKRYGDKLIYVKIFDAIMIRHPDNHPHNHPPYYDRPTLEPSW